MLPNFGGIGLGTRHWETPKWGWDVNVMPSWEFNDFILSASVLYSPWPPKKAKTYFGAGLGFFSYNESIGAFGMDVDYKVSSMSLKAFVGWEWLKGIQKNHGLSFEAGLQFGSSDFDVRSSGPFGSMRTTGTFSLPIIYIGGTYAFYYKK